MRTITYQDNNPNPISGVRTIRVVVSDGTTDASATMTLNSIGNGGGGGGTVPTSTSVYAAPITYGSAQAGSSLYC